MPGVLSSSSRIFRGLTGVMDNDMGSSDMIFSPSSDTLSFSQRPSYDNSSSSAWASCRSFVSNPSVNQP